MEPSLGLQIVDELRAKPSLKGYHLLPSVRGDLLVKLGRFDAARTEFERTASITWNDHEKELLLNWENECEFLSIEITLSMPKRLGHEGKRSDMIVIYGP